MNYKLRREKLLEMLPEYSITVMYSGVAPYSIGDEKYPFKVDRSFYYFTGIERENLYLVLIKLSAAKSSEMLFIEPFDEKMAKWVGGKIKETSCDKLAKLLRDLRDPNADKFKTIVIDTFAALQDDYKVYLETTKGGKALSMQEWGDVAKMVLNLKDNMKRFSEEQGVTFVWITHTSEQELTETSGLNKEIRIIPDLTIKTGIKCMKDASNIFYCCRKTCLNDKGEKEVKFLTYVGPHPLMDTGTRDMLLETGEFVEDFNYDKWQALIKAGVLGETKVLTPEVDTATETKDEETSNEN